MVSKNKTRRTASAMANSVRIIAGQWNRRKLAIATKGSLPTGFRPTSDRLRETLFNWLGQTMHGLHCLDVFAGSGALGFEAASRGAASVHMVENHTGLIRQLQHHKQQLDAQSVSIQQGDAVAVLQQLLHEKPAYFDVVFVDPPYNSSAYTSILQAVQPLLAPSGYVYLEADHQWQPEALAQLDWECWRYTQAGAAHAHVLRLLT